MIIEFFFKYLQEKRNNFFDFLLHTHVKIIIIINKYINLYTQHTFAYIYYTK